MVTAFYMSQRLPGHRFNQEVLGPAIWGGYLAARKAAIPNSKTAKLQELEAAITAAAGDEASIADLTARKEREEAKQDEDRSFITTLKTMPVDTMSPEVQAAVKKQFPDKEITTYSQLHEEIIVKIRPNLPQLLVLASSNCDEALRGFYTKYDASSADINPIGSFAKSFLKEFMMWCANTSELHAEEMRGVQFNVVEDIVNLVASPELTPPTLQGTGAAKKAIIQDDEIEIKMTYADLTLMGKLRKHDHLGPLAMFQRLCCMMKGKSWYIIDQAKKVKSWVHATPENIADKVVTFHNLYAINRHKMNILTNAIHATDYVPDDNRYDHRPFLIPAWWPLQVAELRSQRDAMKAEWDSDPVVIAAKEEADGRRAVEEKLKETEVLEYLETWYEILNNRIERITTQNSVLGADFQRIWETDMGKLKQRYEGAVADLEGQFPEYKEKLDEVYQQIAALRLPEGGAAASRNAAANVAATVRNSSANAAAQAPVAEAAAGAPAAVAGAANSTRGRRRVERRRTRKFQQRRYPNKIWD
jgi:NH3-dependent NAD+ synthetase